MPKRFSFLKDPMATFYQNDIAVKSRTRIKIGVGIAIITACTAIAALPFILSGFESFSFVIGTNPQVTLAAHIAASQDTVQLQWTAPGDDNATGTATAYQIRYATTAISDGNWDSVPIFNNPPTPAVAGTTQQATVTGLSAGTTYFFALKTVDEAGNWSPLSNVVNITTQSAVVAACVESWSCTSWSACENGQQARSCSDARSCGTTVDRPLLTQGCTSGAVGGDDANVSNDVSPNTYFISVPPAVVSTQRVYFNFAGIDDVTQSGGINFSYKMDNGPWTPWSATTRAMFRSMNNGEHTFYVRTRDADGNIDNSASSTTFTVAYTPKIVTGFEAGGSPTVQIVTPSGKVEKQFFAFEKTFRGGVTVALGDFSGTGRKKIIVGAGPGRQGEIALFDTEGRRMASFSPFGTKYRGGVAVTVADIQGDGVDEIITARISGRPDIMVFNYINNGFRNAKLTTLAFSSGVSGLSLAAADLDGDGKDEIAAIPAASGQSLLRVFKPAGNRLVLWKPTIRIFPQTIQGGFTLAAGNVSFDWRPELLVMPKSAKPSQVKTIGLSAANRLSINKKNIYPFGVNGISGGRIAVTDTDGNKVEDVLVARGTKVQQSILIFDGNTTKRIKAISLFPKSSRLILSLSAGVL